MPSNLDASTTDAAGDEPVRLHRQTLIEMNLAPFTARRNAAHERLLEILRGRELVESSKEQRVHWYTLCECLLDEAILATRRSQIDQDTPVIHYLRLLRDTVAAALALVRHEVLVVREAEVFSKLVGNDLVQELQATGDVFSQSEMNILDCIEDLLRFGERICEQDTRARKASFTPEDHRRYDDAFEEYRRFYRTWNPGQRNYTP